jgi:glycosyltransferase involved in cell wall biosynthesis
VGAPRLTVLYISLDYTTHDRRFLASLAAAGMNVQYLRLQQTAVTFEVRDLPAGVQVVRWTPSRRAGGWPLTGVRKLRPFSKALRDARPDVVLAGPLQSGTAMTAAVSARPFVAMSWGSDVLVDAEKTPAARWLTKFALRRSSGVFGDCQAVRDKVHAMVPYADDRIVTFPWGIDLDRFRPGSAESTLRADLGWQDKVVFISTRTWEAHYAIDVLVRSFARLSRRCPDARLLLLGDGSQQRAIHQLLDEHRLNSVVHTPGRIGYEHLPRYFQAADVYVSTALSDGTSISLLEAMACGLPVIVTEGYGNLEWVVPGRNGWLVPPADEDALAHALVDAAGDGERRRLFGDANLPIARDRADWNRNFPKLVSLLERVSGEW